ncbi:hypothetical protein VHA_000003 [Grimontia hollisae CIP 101886]|uniref:Uncharacterized protein n=1 Tax=Grimontia hollisae CIP 101886 TaxID=675812 RepID=D0I2P0_GRIHO|nr:hypothetical protein VHA_000003 [Grimontia hollisae CIP 101886]
MQYCKPIFKSLDTVIFLTRMRPKAGLEFKKAAQFTKLTGR